MTLCDNGLLTYHPSLHVSLGGQPWGRPGPGDGQRGAAWLRDLSEFKWTLP